jgi:hypothetical protein
VNFQIDQKETVKKIISLIHSDENLEIIFNDKIFFKKELEAYLRDYFKGLGFKV